jgi:hypothetical protein
LRGFFIRVLYNASEPAATRLLRGPPAIFRALSDPY